ncbi:MAG: hypothetical protein MUP66_01020 [Candidatus Nanohaloarchaeota archaeon QJJ-5]|nr:hypothetical protein [Candidatus Nanohaloarchaeota archaeon QJJ-5]
MTPEVFNRYDIRGQYPDEIDESFAERFGKAIGTYALQHNRTSVVIGHDTREHSRHVYNALSDGLRSTGVTVIDIELGPTDRLGMAAQHYGGMGVMVTASHHAWERTGFKIIYEQGYGIGNDDLDAIQSIYTEGEFITGEGTLINERYEFDEHYIETILEYLEDLPTCDGTIVLDCANGATASITPMLFEEAGFDVHTINNATSGGGTEPEPRPANREQLEQTVSEMDADLGLAFDPDGDRVLAVHPDYGWLNGNEVGYLLGTIIDAETITASLDSSPVLEQAGDVTYTRVGDVFVSATGYEQDADLLVEPNGHYAITDLAWYNSGTIAGLFLATIHEEIPQRLADAPDYITIRQSIEYASDEAVEDAVAAAIRWAAKHHEITSTDDGVKLQADETTILVRPSGTSTKVRIVANGRDQETIETLIEELKDQI